MTGWRRIVRMLVFLGLALVVYFVVPVRAGDEDVVVRAVVCLLAFGLLTAGLFPAPVPCDSLPSILYVQHSQAAQPLSLQLVYNQSTFLNGYVFDVQSTGSYGGFHFGFTKEGPTGTDPATFTGSMTPYGVTRPVRPTFTRISNSFVVTSSGGYLYAIAHRGAFDVAPNLRCKEIWSTLMTMPSMSCSTACRCSP